MNGTSRIFLDHLRRVKAENGQLTQILGADWRGVYVYYLAPYSNLVRIWEAGGILPHNEVEETSIDLSDNRIQNRRDRMVRLFNQGSERMVKLHDCVNFFLNPLNDTFFQFRRNALIRAQAGDPWSQLVCILEIDLERLLQKEHLFWGVTDQNAAVSSSIVAGASEVYRKFNWQAIYSVARSKEGNQQSKNNKARSAEWIVYANDPQTRQKISVEYIKRILVLERDYQNLGNIQLQQFPLNLTRLTHVDGYRVLDDPLYSDKKWAASLAASRMSQDLVSKTLKRLSQVESEIGLSLKDSFESQTIANHSLHGMAHVIRVMFWVLVLADLSTAFGHPVSEEEKTAALYAAFIHDLCRWDDTINAEHGELAANRFRRIVQEKLPASTCERCLTAVRVHSLNVDPQDSDVVWMLLKDADAFDRGRFSPPTRETGCNLQMLRMTFLKKNRSLANQIAWSSYWLPRVTCYINWKENPCQDFVKTLLYSLNLVSRAMDVDLSVRNIARETCLRTVGVVKG